MITYLPTSILPNTLAARTPSSVATSFRFARVFIYDNAINNLPTRLVIINFHINSAASPGTRLFEIVLSLPPSRPARVLRWDACRRTFCDKFNLAPNTFARPDTADGRLSRQAFSRILRRISNSPRFFVVKRKLKKSKFSTNRRAIRKTGTNN